MFAKIEAFLFEEFPKLPLSARVITYFILLFVFIYLLLMPRFIDGQLVVKDKKTGGLIPYRGADIQLQVDGRDYKFRSNEGGYWSIPIVSRVPSRIEVQIFHEDIQQWFKVEFAATEALSPGSHQIEISNAPPYLKTAARGPSSGESWQSPLGHRWPSIFSEAVAGELVLSPPPMVVIAVPPTGATSAPPAVATAGGPREADAAGQRPTPSAPVAPMAHVVRPPLPAQSVRVGVTAEFGKALGKPPAAFVDSFPMMGAQAPTYVEKIRIVEGLEHRFGLRIPDEHWKAFATMGEVVNYIDKRLILQKLVPTLNQRKATWADIQQSLPFEQRPIFKSSQTVTPAR